METIHLTGNEPLISKIAARVGYNGKKFKLRTKETVDITYNAYWSEGSKSTYTFIRLDTMESVQAPTQHPYFDRPVKDASETPLAPGLICVEHCYFCGKDMGITLYVHPQGMNPGLLPAPTAELSLNERIVLYATRSMKSSYAGIKDYRFHSANCETGIDRGQWDDAKRSLIAEGYLNKAGAITVKGRNAVGSAYGWPK